MIKKLIILLIFCNIASAEIVLLGDLVKINIPKDKTYTKYNKLEHTKKNMSDAKLQSTSILKNFLKLRKIVKMILEYLKMKQC